MEKMERLSNGCYGEGQKVKKKVVFGKWERGSTGLRRPWVSVGEPILTQLSVCELRLIDVLWIATYVTQVARSSPSIFQISS
ncbi:hypothetical protein HAX54_038809 [Datura stramonium]|uniref:Uncharacterized protein n=1 Tax=Datura stramonium TaxID=4076 RepID=A0ABS8VLZ8_DATST|nr:hypothetical protein [Datura stramonium]